MLKSRFCDSTSSQDEVTGTRFTFCLKQLKTVRIYEPTTFKYWQQIINNNEIWQIGSKWDTPEFPAHSLESLVSKLSHWKKEEIEPSGQYELSSQSWKSGKAKVTLESREPARRALHIEIDKGCFNHSVEYWSAQTCEKIIWSQGNKCPKKIRLSNHHHSYRARTISVLTT